MSLLRQAANVIGFLAWAVSHDLRHFARVAAVRTLSPSSPPSQIAPRAVARAGAPRQNDFGPAAAAARELASTLDEIRRLPEVSR